MNEEEELAVLMSQLEQIMDPDEFGNFRSNLERGDYDPEVAHRSF